MSGNGTSTVTGTKRSLFRAVPFCKQTEDEWSKRHISFSDASDFSDVPCQQPAYPDMSEYGPQTTTTAASTTARAGVERNQAGNNPDPNGNDTWVNVLDIYRSFLEFDCSALSPAIPSGRVVNSVTISMTGKFATPNSPIIHGGFYVADGNVDSWIPDLSTLSTSAFHKGSDVDAFWRGSAQHTIGDETPPPVFLPFSEPLTTYPSDSGQEFTWEASGAPGTDFAMRILAGGTAKMFVLHEWDILGTFPIFSRDNAGSLTNYFNMTAASLSVNWSDPPPPEPPPPPIPTGPITRTLYADWTGAAPVANRNWSEWTTPATSMAHSRRSDGSLAILFGTCDGSGRILRLDSALHNDDGEAIDSFYQTAFVGGPSGRNTFQYMTASVAGDGSLGMTAILPDDIVKLRDRDLKAHPNGDTEWSGLRVNGERVAFRFGTNEVDGWYKMRKMAIWGRPSPWSRTRGN